MVNHRLDTFLKAAELGSFSRAAKALYITPSAVIQQIGQLEKALNAKLFERSSHGICLTKSGLILQEYALKAVREERVLRERLASSQKPEVEELVVLTDFLYKPRQFNRLWKRHAPEGVSVRMLPLLDRRDDFEKADLIECVQDGEFWQKQMSFFRICDMPIALAAPAGHPLHEREGLTMQELHGQRIITIGKGMSRILDDFAREASAHGAEVIEVGAYNMSVFSRCEMEGALLQIPQCWGDLYAGFRAIGGNWSYTLPYGFFTKLNCKPVLKEFFARIQKTE